jgi:hypothetical protein
LAVDAKLARRDGASAYSPYEEISAHEVTHDLAS